MEVLETNTVGIVFYFLLLKSSEESWTILGTGWLTWFRPPRTAIELLWSLNFLSVQFCAYFLHLFCIIECLSIPHD